MNEISSQIEHHFECTYYYLYLSHEESHCTCTIVCERKVLVELIGIISIVCKHTLQLSIIEKHYIDTVWFNDIAYRHSYEATFCSSLLNYLYLLLRV